MQRKKQDYYLSVKARPLAGVQFTYARMNLTLTSCPRYSTLTQISKDMLVCANRKFVDQGKQVWVSITIL